MQSIGYQTRTSRDNYIPHVVSFSLKQLIHVSVDVPEPQSFKYLLVHVSPTLQNKYVVQAKEQSYWQWKKDVETDSGATVTLTVVNRMIIKRSTVRGARHGDFNLLDLDHASY